MFAPGFVTLFFVALFAAGNVAGYPVPEPLKVRCPFYSKLRGYADSPFSAR